jgi:hypothetical protein
MRNITRLVVAIFAGCALIVPAVALANTKHDQLTVAPCGHPGRGCGPAVPVTRGQVFYLLLQGYAVNPANSVLSFADTSPCPSVYHDELNRARANQAAYLGAVSVGPGKFGKAAPVSSAKSASMPLGNDYVCSYLKEVMRIPRRVTKPTYAHASTRLTVTT